MKLSQIKQILAERNLELTKSLGQNFLHDANQLKRIAQAAELKRGDRVLEIGPGLGPLTEMVVKQAAEVLAIEKDHRLVALLGERFGETADPAGPLRLIHDDALHYIKQKRRDWRGWKLVANLPYSVASPILVELALASPGPDRMVVTLQLEVAQRLMAEPGHKNYGLLTLLVQLDYQADDWFRIPANCFYPVPEVDSACICMTRRNSRLLPADETGVFTKIVKRSFSQRRKMMIKLLKEDWPERKLPALFEKAQIPEQARAEAVSLEQFVRLTQLLSAH